MTKIFNFFFVLFLAVSRRFFPTLPERQADLSAFVQSRVGYCKDGTAEGRRWLQSKVIGFFSPPLISARTRKREPNQLRCAG